MMTVSLSRWRRALLGSRHRRAYWEGASLAAPATATVGIAGPVIWFVMSDAPAGGNGTLSSPFNSLATADAVDAAGHAIFVYTGSYTSGITLNSAERLIGQGVTGTSFDAVFGITPPTGTLARPSIGRTRPTLGGTVTLASNSSMRGLNVQPGTGTEALTANVATSVAASDVDITAANAAGVALNSVNGVTLSRVAINVAGQSGIAGSNVSGLDVSNSSIQGGGTTADERGISIAGLSGVNKISDSTVAATGGHSVVIGNGGSVPTPGQLTIIDSRFENPGAAGRPSDAVNITLAGAADLSGDVKNSGWNQAPINVVGGHSSAGALSVTGNPPISGGVGSGVDVVANGVATVRATIANNPSINTESPNNNGIGLNLSGNDIAKGAGAVDYFLEKYTGNTFQLQSFVSDGTSPADVANFINRRNLDGASVDAQGAGSSINHTAAICATP